MKLFHVKFICTTLIALTISIYTCNGSFNEPQLFITKGTFEDDYNLAQYIVSIQSKKSFPHGFRHYCGGTVIGERKILTSAHCAFKPEGGEFATQELVAVAGIRNRFDREKNIGRVVDIERIRIHKRFKYPDSYAYDIAIMFLKEKISSDVEPIVGIAKLTKDAPRRKQTCTTLGWGQVFWRGPLTAELGFANVEILNDGSCYDAYEQHFSKGMICAHNPRTKAGPCHGDSGGPLFCKNTIAGVISFGSRCGVESGPSSYSDVDYFRKWIESKGSTGYINLFILILSMMCVI